MERKVVLGPGLPPMPEELLVARDRGEVLFIVGAGASYPAPSNLPGFKGLVQDIYAIVDPTMVAPLVAVQQRDGPKWNEVQDILNDFQRTELKFFCQNEFDVVLGMLERRIDGDFTKGSSVRQATQTVLERTTEPNALHRALVVLGQRYGRTLLVTTNFDRLLSRAAKSMRFGASALALGQMPNPSRSVDFNGILHMHGMLPLDKEPGSAVILTDQDFGDAYLRRHNATSFLYDAARIYHLVLVGYSANDSPVRYLLNALASDERHFDDIRKRYAFISCPPGDARLPTEWSSRGIMPIPYDPANGHRQLENVLVAWSQVTPDRRNEKNLKARLLGIARLDPDSTDGEAEKPFLRFILERSTEIEREDLIKFFGSAEGSAKWISFFTEYARERGRRAN